MTGTIPNFKVIVIVSERDTTGVWYYFYCRITVPLRPKTPFLRKDSLWVLLTVNCTYVKVFVSRNVTGVWLVRLLTTVFLVSPRYPLCDTM